MSKKDKILGTLMDVRPTKSGTLRLRIGIPMYRLPTCTTATGGKEYHASLEIKKPADIQQFSDQYRELKKLFPNYSINAHVKGVKWVAAANEDGLVYSLKGKSKGQLNLDLMQRNKDIEPEVILILGRAMGVVTSVNARTRRLMKKAKAKIALAESEDEAVVAEKTKKVAAALAKVKKARKTTRKKKEDKSA